MHTNFHHNQFDLKPLRCLSCCAPGCISEVNLCHVYHRLPTLDLDTVTERSIRDRLTADLGPITKHHALIKVRVQGLVLHTKLAGTAEYHALCVSRSECVTDTVYCCEPAGFRQKSVRGIHVVAAHAVLNIGGMPVHAQFVCLHQCGESESKA